MSAMSVSGTNIMTYTLSYKSREVMMGFLLDTEESQYSNRIIILRQTYIDNDRQCITIDLFM